MKKLLVCLTVAAFACVSAVQAGEGKACDQSKAACAEVAKAKSSCASACATACSGAKVAKKKVDLSVKGATLLVMR